MGEAKKNSASMGAKYARMFLLAVAAGFAIGIGGIVFLSLDNKVIGALMFTVGLYAICTQKLFLFTGKVGYLLENGTMFLLDLCVIWLGNFVGTALAAQGALHSRISGVSEKAADMCAVKLGDNFGSLFILGIFCGFLMFVAVDGYLETENPVILFMGVAGFILCGFEHCVADMFYFSVAGMWSTEALWRVLTITLGNSLGGLAIPAFKMVSLVVGED